MSVIDVSKDLDALTMRMTAEFAAPIAKVWQVWENPRLLERWWGPPTHPATMVEHDLTPGGRVAYFMTSPEGERYHGWWRIVTVDPPNGLELEDGFADATGAPLPEMPVTVMRVTLVEQPTGFTRMTVDAQYATREGMEQVIAMGVEEGMTQAVNQIDGLLTTAVSS
jgi:uncharacterized protein YndB with AHSA1/START domain